MTSFRHACVMLALATSAVAGGPAVADGPMGPPPTVSIPIPNPAAVATEIARTTVDVPRSAIDVTNSGVGVDQSQATGVNRGSTNPTGLTPQQHQQRVAAADNAKRNYETASDVAERAIKGGTLSQEEASAIAGAGGVDAYVRNVRDGAYRRYIAADRRAKESDSYRWAPR
jgi:hypothetical protein